LADVFPIPLKLDAQKDLRVTQILDTDAFASLLRSGSRHSAEHFAEARLSDYVKAEIAEAPFIS